MLREALTYGTPEVFNTDQGSQFTSDKFTGILKDHEIDISMDGRGRALDNIFVVRLWRSVKYEEVYLHDYATPVDAQLGLDRYFRFYNKERFHQSLNYRTPTEVYRDARNGFSKAWEYISSDDNDQIISGAGSNAPRLNHRLDEYSSAYPSAGCSPVVPV